MGTSVFTNRLIDYFRTGIMEYDLAYAMNGGLGGLVAITANCCVVTPGMACIIGIIGGWVYLGGSKLLRKLKIDDAVDAIPFTIVMVYGDASPQVYSQVQKRKQSLTAMDRKDYSMVVENYSQLKFAEHYGLLLGSWQ